MKKQKKKSEYHLLSILNLLCFFIYNKMNTTTTAAIIITPDDSSFVVLSSTIHKIVLSFYIIFGLIGNIFNILLFQSAALRQTSTSFYLLSESISNLIVVCLTLPIRLLSDGFGLNVTDYSLLSCQLISYIYFTCLALPPIFTTLACVDRWAASCVEVNRRRFANKSMAKRMIPLAIIFCGLIYAPIFVTFDMSTDPPPPFCSISLKYAFCGLIYYLLTYSIIPPGFMIGFTIGVILHIRRKRTGIVHVAPPVGQSISNDSHSTRGNRRRLSPMQFMLICQAFSECLLTLPFSLTNILSLFVDYDQHFLMIYSYTRLLLFISYVSSFYIFTLSSKLYREEFKKFIRRLWHRQ